MRDTPQELAGGPLGFGKKKLESLFVLTFLSFRDKDFCYKFQHRNLSHLLSEVPSQVGLQAVLGEQQRDVGHGWGEVARCPPSKASSAAPGTRIYPCGSH